MKRSSKVTLTVLAGLTLAGCGRRYDPCDAETFNAAACRDAIRQGGYYYGGHWHAMSYMHPYPYYYDAYNRHVARGGAVHSAPHSSYARPSSSSTTRGGFGATGSGHSSGGHAGTSAS
jgi:hypothetical protein